MTKKIMVGTVGYPIKKEQFLNDIDVLEMTEARYIPPGKKAARHIKQQLPPTVEPVVQISRYFFKAPQEKVSLKGDISAYGDFKVTSESMGLWKRQLDFARELGAGAQIIITPAAVTPSGRTVESMSAFFKEIDRGGLPVFWEPHGVWERSQMEKFAGDHNLLLAVDPLRDSVLDGDKAYFRFGAFASAGSRMGVYELEQIALAVDECKAGTVYCIFETQRAVDDARNLKEMLLSGIDDNEFDY